MQEDLMVWEKNQKLLVLLIYKVLMHKYLPFFFNSHRKQVHAAIKWTKTIKDEIDF